MIVPLPTPDAPIITNDLLFIPFITIYYKHNQQLLYMQDYKIETKRGQGSYSIVYQAIKRNGPSYEKFALKIMKQPYESLAKIKKDKQIKALYMLNHPNIIKLIDVLFDENNQKMALVFELMDANLYEYYKNKKANGGFSLERIREMMHSLISAVSYIHHKGIFHRDLKPQNILVKGEKIIKIADFGSCKSYFSQKPYTEYIATRWYRAPECLMTDGYYSQKMDVWSLGCILFELYTLFPLFPGKNQTDQINTIFTILGTPPKQKLSFFANKASHMKFEFTQSPGIGIESLAGSMPSDMIDLLYKMLRINPNQRPTCDQILTHPFFSVINELKKYQSKVISKMVDQKHSIFPPIGKNRKH